MAWLAVNLAGLAAGFFPGLIVVPTSVAPSAPPASLQTLITAQVCFLLLVCPLSLLPPRRAGEDDDQTAFALGRCLIGWAAEAALWLAMAAPFVMAGAHLADAAVQDVVRAELLVLAAFVTAWGLATLAARGRTGMSLASLIGVLAVLAGPFAVYLAWEFVSASPAVWHAAVPTFAWSAAQSRLGGWTPAPAWAWLLWPALGVALMLLYVVVPRRRP